MPNVFFDSPQTMISGTAKERDIQMLAYLTYLSEKLNEALNCISVEQMAPEVQNQIQVSGSQASQQAAESDKKYYNNLKGLIIKTAELVRHEVDEISTSLKDSYNALSKQYGEYSRNLESNIKATAEGVLQSYSFEERIDELQQSDGNTRTFIDHTNQFIFTGLVEDNGPGNRKYGIAIGQDVTSYDEHGEPTLNHANKMATFTMDKLSFYQGGVEVAYFSNNSFNINKGKILQELQMGNFMWTIVEGSIALKKIQGGGGNGN